MELQYQWDTEEEEETGDNTVSYRTNAIRIALDRRTGDSQNNGHTNEYNGFK